MAMIVLEECHLFPGCFMPLFIFEQRYRLMVKQCLESGRPFGVIRMTPSGLADVGTIAEIREATRYVDGRWDLVTFGTKRFSVVRMHRDAPYLRAEITVLGEPVGDADEAAALAERVSAGFIDYLDLLRGSGQDGEEDPDDNEEGGEEDEVTPEAIDEALAEEGGPELSEEIVAEIERLLVASNATGGPTRIVDADDDESDEDDEDGELLETAIDRLTGSDDPVGLSHVVGGVVQLTGDQRQELLSAPDAAARLALLVRHLQRENLLLAEGVRPRSADARGLAERRN